MAALLRKLFNVGPIIGFGLILVFSFFVGVGGKFGGAPGKTSLITGVPFAYADAPAPPHHQTTIIVAGCGSGGCGCGCGSGSSSSD